MVETLVQAQTMRLIGIEIRSALPVTAATMIWPIFAATGLAVTDGSCDLQTSFMPNFPKMHIHDQLSWPDARESKNKLQSVELVTRHRRACD